MYSKTEQKLIKAGQLTAGILELEGPSSSLKWKQGAKDEPSVASPPLSPGSSHSGNARQVLWTALETGPSWRWHSLIIFDMVHDVKFRSHAGTGAAGLLLGQGSLLHLDHLGLKPCTQGVVTHVHVLINLQEARRLGVKDLGSGVGITGPHTRQVCLLPVMPKGLTLYSGLAPLAQGCCLSPQSTGMASVSRHAPAGSKPQCCGQRMVLDNSEQNSVNNTLCCQKLLL